MVLWEQTNIKPSMDVQGFRAQSYVGLDLRFRAAHERALRSGETDGSYHSDVADSNNNIRPTHIIQHTTQTTIMYRMLKTWLPTSWGMPPSGGPIQRCSRPQTITNKLNQEQKQMPTRLQHLFNHIYPPSPRPARAAPQPRRTTSRTRTRLRTR